MTTGGARWPLLLVIAALLIGCTNAPTGSEPELTLEQQLERIADDARAARLVRQADQIADGEVTEAEYRQALADSLACMESAGMTVTPIEKVETISGFQFETSFQFGTLGASRGEEVAERCQTEHYVYILDAWATQEGEDLTDRSRPLMQACLQELGFDATDLRDHEDMLAATDGSAGPIASCTRTVMEQLNGPDGHL